MIEPLETRQSPSGGLERELEERLGLGPVLGQDGLHLSHQLRPVGGEETGLGQDGGLHHLLHPPPGLLRDEDLAEDVESLPGVVKGLGPED